MPGGGDLFHESLTGLPGGNLVGDAIKEAIRATLGQYVNSVGEEFIAGANRASDSLAKAMHGNITIDLARPYVLRAWRSPGGEGQDEAFRKPLRPLT